MPPRKSSKLYELSVCQLHLRIVGQPVPHATCRNCQRLRCSRCGDVHAAWLPPEASGPKFDETAVAMIAVCRYGLGLPHNRLAQLQKFMHTRKFNRCDVVPPGNGEQTWRDTADFRVLVRIRIGCRANPLASGR